MHRICIYCGSSPGARKTYSEAAKSLATALAKTKRGIVYGGGNIGIMGVLADAALAAGAEVIGVIPHSMVKRELAHRGLTRLQVVGSMHERKAVMAELADGFIALPGGLGTLEELFEIWTWAQLGIHRKPIGLLNVEDFYTPLVAFIDRLVTERFVRHENRDILFTSADPGQLLEKMESFQPVMVPKSIGPQET